MNAVPESSKSQIIGSSSNQVSNNSRKQKKRIIALDEKNEHVVSEPEVHASDEPCSPPPKRIKLRSPRTPRKTSTQVQTGFEKAVSQIGVEKTDLVPFDRPAGPHRTNAPLKTPRGSRLITYPKETTDLSPSKTGLPRPTTTTGHILEEGCAHLVRADARLKPLIEKHHCRTFSSEGLAEEIDPFHSLCSGIMAQQVSGAAAKAIKNRFIGLFQQAQAQVEGEGREERPFPTPAQVTACEVPFLRQAGLSGRKAEYMKGLAEKFASGELSAAMLIKASDEEVLERLTAVRGLGRWSVEMFACFGLKRMDVLSTGDLGVQ
jgi:DNA-3-methyladenine glycosylase II